jgi:hypothetical protein
MLYGTKLLVADPVAGKKFLMYVGIGAIVTSIASAVLFGFVVLF